MQAEGMHKQRGVLSIYCECLQDGGVRVTQKSITDRLRDNLWQTEPTTETAKSVEFLVMVTRSCEPLLNCSADRCVDCSLNCD